MILACFVCCGCADPLEDAVREGQVAVAAAIRDVAADYESGVIRTPEEAMTKLRAKVEQERSVAHVPLFAHIDERESASRPQYAAALRRVSNAFQPDAFDPWSLAFALVGFAGGAWFVRGTKA